MVPMVLAIALLAVCSSISAHSPRATDSTSTHYSGNKSPDAQCGMWTPTPERVSFSIKSVPNTDGQGDGDVRFSMRNTSGCQVTVRALGKVIHSEIAAVGGIYTYACPYGYIPTEMNGHDAVTAPVTQFICKYRGY